MTLVLREEAVRFTYQIEHLVRLFYPLMPLVVVTNPAPDTPAELELALVPEGTEYRLTVGVGATLKISQRLTSKADTKAMQRELARILFGLLVTETGTLPPWGTLIGVRPVRLVHHALEEGKTPTEAEQLLQTEYLVTPQKAQLATQIAQRQLAVFAGLNEKDFSLYISIPFCPTRCHYCSFVSHSTEKTSKLIPEYIIALCKEIKETGELSQSLGLTLRTVYMGGGTPTTLEPDQLTIILDTIAESFPLENLTEYTIEAGRPDTITKEKLLVMREHGVSRISINPQTMNPEVLRTIGRNHTPAETLEAFALARAVGGFSINMDVIIGLEGETAESYYQGLEQIIALDPENITVHTLTIKRASQLWEEGAFARLNRDITEQVNESRRRLEEAGYQPYYLYRQKGILNNLENIGYAKPGTHGLYNIYSMEEIQSIFAVGAAGATKLYARPNTLARLYNYKFPYEYLANFKEISNRKQQIRSFYERNNQ